MTTKTKELPVKLQDRFVLLMALMVRSLRCWCAVRRRSPSANQ